MKKKFRLSLFMSKKVHKALTAGVLASELAKSHTKAPKSGMMSRSLVAGVLACVLSCGTIFPLRSYAAVVWTDDSVITGNGYGIYLGYDSALGTLYMNPNPFYYNQYDTDHVIGIKINEGGSSSNSDPNAIYNLSVNGTTITYTKGNGTTGTITTQDSNTTYSAGDGVSLSGTTFSAKAGTNVTVNSDGINVTGNGSVASRDTGLIDGGKLYSEVRPSDNGNYEEYFSTLL